MQVAQNRREISPADRRNLAQPLSLHRRLYRRSVIGSARTRAPQALKIALRAQARSR